MQRLFCTRSKESSRVLLQGRYCFRWTVIIHRFDGSGDFDQNWEAYKIGFGEANQEYWLGNEYLHYLTNTRSYKLRFVLQDWSGETRYAEYSSFAVTSEADEYRLLLGDYSGTASTNEAHDITDGFLYQNNSQFSTKDRDNDRTTDPADSCVLINGYGGFWYNSCCKVGPTTLHYCTAYTCGTFRQHIRWRAWSDRSLKSIKMMMRPQTYM